MKKITVYSVPNCQKCNATKRWLRSAGIDFAEEDASLDPETASAIRYIAETDGEPCIMPYVQVSNGDPELDFHWFDFRPDYLEKYCK